MEARTPPQNPGIGAQTHGVGGNGRYNPPPPGTRSADQVRADVVAQRHELARSVDALRTRWSRATDVKRQLREHKGELIAGAAVVGLIAGAAFALKRRR
jgi:hypothetical protein